MIATYSASTVVEDSSRAPAMGVFLLKSVARISSGRQVVVLGGDGVQDTLRHMGADLRQVEILRPERGFSLPGDVGAVVEVVQRLRPIMVVVPNLGDVTSPGIDAVREADINALLESLDRIALEGPGVVAVVRVAQADRAVVVKACARACLPDASAPAEGV